MLQWELKDYDEYVDETERRRRTGRKGRKKL
jgi:hypothetical protein